MKHHFPIFCLLLLLPALRLSAQFYPGMAFSNFGGITTVSNDPSIADSKYLVDVSLGAASFDFSNNYQGLSNNSIFTKTAFKSYLNADVFRDQYYGVVINNYNLNSLPKNFFYGTQMQGPGSFLLSFGKKNKNAIAVSYNLNVIKNINFLEFKGDPSTIPTVSSIKSMAWADYGVTYSRVLLDKGQHFLKAGVTMKLLQGLGADYLNVNNAGTAATYAHTNGYYYNNDSTTYNYSYAPPSVGFDLGATYEWRPKKAKYQYEMDGDKNLFLPDVNLYTLAAGFSVVDMGVINFNAANASGNYTLPGDIPQTTVNSAQGSDAIDQFLQTKATQTSITSNFKMLLPTRFNVFVAGNAVDGLGGSISTTISPSFRNMQVHYIDNLILTPHWESTWIGVYMPVSYDANNNLDLGLAFRLGVVSVGVQNIIGLATNDLHNSCIYAAVKIPFYRHKPSDMDGDLVSDKYDQCPHQRGTWATRGCPDRDGDGVADRDDSCPDVAGPVENHGCPWPDTDKDGVPDKDDSCPTVAGPVENHGCPWPDRDHDGVPDKDDSCPDVAGPVENHGCPWPDRDHDGVPDKDDWCPNVPGDPAHHGCPDTDGDGLYDYEDSCPTVRGPIQNHGCPWPDSDGDGIPDKDDWCPDIKGEPEYHGCPPPLSDIARKKFTDFTYDTITFESKSAELLSFSKAKMKKHVYAYLKDHYDVDLEVRAYADELEGDSISNVSLSESRAQAIKDYLVSLGIDESRIEIDGLGTAPPPADNRVLTPMARKWNRSAVLTLKIVTR